MKHLKLYTCLIFAVTLVAISVLAQILLTKNQPEIKQQEELSLSESQATEEKKKPVTLSFVGDVSLADNWHIAPKYDSRGGITGILGENILKVMKDSDLMVANSEFTVSTRGQALNKTYTFRAKPERLKIYNEMGVDLVSLANNHVYDYGETAFLDMLEAFEKYQIPHIGAGRNLEEAEKPYITEINGYKFAFVAATRAEKNIVTAGATKTSPGVFRCYDPSEMIRVIEELRKDESINFIIPIIHFGRENSHDLEKEQVDSAKKYIDAGADAIIGHHAHVLQGFEIYKDKPIVYNLGNFLFNQNEVDTALFEFKITEEGNLEYYILPALQKDYKTELVEGSKKAQIIKDLNSWSVNVNIDANGKITKR